MMNYPNDDRDSDDDNEDSSEDLNENEDIENPSGFIIRLPSSSVNAAPFAPVNKTKNQVQWTPDMKFALAKEVYQASAYMKTNESKLIKFGIVLHKLKHTNSQSKLFNNLEIQVKALETQFKLCQKVVVDKFALDKEGANLSARIEAPTEYEKLMIEMWRKSNEKIEIALAKMETKKSQSKMTNAISNN